MQKFHNHLLAIGLLGLVATSVNAQGISSDPMRPSDRLASLIALVAEGDFASVWKTAQPDAIGNYAKALMTIDPGCKPGNPIFSYRMAARAARDLEYPNHLRFDYQKNALKALPSDKVRSLRDRLHNELQRLRNPSALAIIDWSVVQPSGFDPYPCYQSHPLPKVTPAQPSLAVGDRLQPYVCYDPNRKTIADRAARGFKRNGPPVGSFFSQLRLLKVQVIGHSDKMEQQIILHIVNSLRLWYLACSNCPPESAAILQNGERLWMIEDYLTALHSTPVGSNPRTTIPQLGERVERRPNDVIFSKRFGDSYGRRALDGRRQSDYVEISRSDPLVQRFCSRSDLANDEPLALVQRLICGRDSPTATYTLSLIENGNTSCGRDRVIACGIPQIGIQFNTADFAFKSSFDEGRTVFGNGATSVDLLRVVLHETGHWIGFQHVGDDRKGDMMYEGYNPKSCISDQNALDMERLTLEGNTSRPKSALLYK